MLSTPTSPPPPAATLRVLWVCTGLACLLQLLLTGISLPLSALLSDAAPLYIDHPYHLYQIELGRELLTQGRMIGYDPLFGSGHVGGMTFNLSARLPVLLSAVLPAQLSSAVLYKLYLLGCALMAPLALGCLARVLRWSTWHTTLGLLIGLSLWWAGPLRWYHTAGMASFVAACYCAPVYAVWVWKTCTETSIRRTACLLAGLLGGLGLWLHPLFALLAGVVFLAQAACQWRQLHRRDTLLALLGIAGIALVLNLPWLHAMHQAPALAASQPYQRAVGWHIIANELFATGSVSPSGALLLPLLIATIVGGFIIRLHRTNPAPMPLLIAGSALLCLAAFGGASEWIAPLQPNRLASAGSLLLALCAASLLADALPGSQTRNLRILAACLGLLICSIAAREVIREIRPGTHGRYGKAPPEISAAPQSLTRLIAWIEQETSAEGRILFETSLGRTHGGGHIAGYLALRTRRQFVGGAYPFTLPDTSFWDGSALGQHIDSLAPSTLREALDTLNVGWMIVHSTQLAKLLEKVPGVEKQGMLDGLHLFRHGGERSFVHAGKARIVATSTNAITLDIQGQEEVVLRYRWVPGLHASPTASIRRSDPGNGLPPLIAVQAKPGQVTLHFD